MMFSVSLFYSSRDFLKLSSHGGLTIDSFRNYFKTFKYSQSDRIIEISLKCGWAKITPEGNLLLTERGKEISNLEYKEALLFQLEDIISNYNPSWASILPKGRTEAKYFLPSEILQCFKEAGLFDDLNDSLIKYWDKLSVAYRNYSQKKMLEIGRIGEKLSFEYELQRTSIIPIWQSVESNLSGFDLLSVVDSNNLEKLQIEVKTSTSNLQYAKMHLTKHEWNTAKNGLNYLFHLWIIANEPRLYIVTIEEMCKHIPRDSGHGDWELVEIPYRILIS